VRSILDLPRLANDPSAPFPPTRDALKSPNGLLAWGGDLNPRRLLAAYRAGIFPWYSAGQPVLWWSPAPRCVIYPDQAHLSRRTRRRYNSGIYRLSADTAFEAVLTGCAQPRAGESGTWITPALRRSFVQLHDMGHAHSIEVWQEDRLCGGIYGLSIGGVFFGESMFSRATDASKIALLALCRQLAAWNYGLLDCQVGNPHLFRMGAVEIDRRTFEAELSYLVAQDQPVGAWTDRVKFAPHW